MSHLGPPFSFHFYKFIYQVLDLHWHTFNFPFYISFPAPPSLTQMLHNRLGFINSYSFWQYIIYLFHELMSQFQIEIRAYSLFTYVFGEMSGMSTFELSRQ